MLLFDWIEPVSPGAERSVKSASISMLSRESIAWRMKRGGGYVFWTA